MACGRAAARVAVGFNAALRRSHRAVRRLQSWGCSDPQGYSRPRSGGRRRPQPSSTDRAHAAHNSNRLSILLHRGLGIEQRLHVLFEPARRIQNHFRLREDRGVRAGSVLLVL